MVGVVLIVGLGNPGQEYAATRHNVGWMLIDLLADRLETEMKESPFQGLIGRTTRENQEIVLLKPTTYMNLSGESVRACADAFAVDVSSTLVAVDEVQFPVGRIRLSTGGSDAGHNGVASVAECFEDEGFRRLRIGVGAPPKGEMKDYVLSPFTDEERELNQETLTFAADAVLDWIGHQADEAAFIGSMGRYNARKLQPAYLAMQAQLAEQTQEETQEQIEEKE